MILSFSQTWPWNGDPTHFVSKIKSNVKLHTIRKDKHRRWREGMDIHFATGVRTPNYNQFESGVCTGVQEIEILYSNASYTPGIFVDGRLLSYSEAKEMVRNDGFDSWQQFEEWFDEDFEGRLIHWAGMEY